MMPPGVPSWFIAEILDLLPFFGEVIDRFKTGTKSSSSNYFSHSNYMSLSNNFSLIRSGSNNFSLIRIGRSQIARAFSSKLWMMDDVLINLKD